MYEKFFRSHPWAPTLLMPEPLPGEPTSILESSWAGVWNERERKRFTWSPQPPWEAEAQNSWTPRMSELEEA